MKIVSLIPLRGGSKGVPRKNIKLLKNHPLCYYVINASKKCSLINETWISTDDDEIESICTDLNVNVHRRNPKCGLDNSSSDSVIKDFIDSHNDIDIIVLIQATNPFTKEIDLTNAINKFNSNKYKLLIGVIESHTFLWKENNGFIYRVNDKIRTRQLAEPEYEEDGSYYIFNKNDFIKNNYIFPSDHVGYNINSNHFHVEIDEPIDFEIVKLLSKYLPD
jgi:CMP-N,N'-diacetyllegionaminic acid synthase